MHELLEITGRGEEKDLAAPDVCALGCVLADSDSDSDSRFQIQARFSSSLGLAWVRGIKSRTDPEFWDRRSRSRQETDRPDQTRQVVRLVLHRPDLVDVVQLPGPA